MKNRLFVLLLLIGVVSASVTCVGDATPNLRTNLYLMCQTELLSSCWASVSYRDTPNITLEFVPPKCFGIDKECWFTDSNGSFSATIPIGDDEFAIGGNYTVFVKCVDDMNLSTSTNFNFTAVNYVKPAVVNNLLQFVHDNIIWFMGIVFLLLILLVILIWLRSAGIV